MSKDGSKIIYAVKKQVCSKKHVCHLQRTNTITSKKQKDYQDVTLICQPASTGNIKRQLEIFYLLQELTAPGHLHVVFFTPQNV